MNDRAGMQHRIQLTVFSEYAEDFTGCDVMVLTLKAFKLIGIGLALVCT